MDFKDQVINEFVRRIKSGQNIESARGFNASDFPNATQEDISDFCSEGYAKHYYYNVFSLNPDYAKSILEEYGLL